MILSILFILQLSSITSSTKSSCDGRRSAYCSRLNQRQQPIRKDEGPSGNGEIISWDRGGTEQERRTNDRRKSVSAGEDLENALPSGSLPMGSMSSGSTLVGEVCRENVDCVQGALCEEGRCNCMLSHVQIDAYCWKRMNPEESGCTYDDQCEAVSPGSRCVFSICRCSGNRSPSATREGPVCHPQGHCPTNGANSLLYNRNSASLAQCFFFDGESDRRASKFIGCDDFPEVYDCIDGLCCPTRALTCIQPMDAGDELMMKSNMTQAPLLRWFFNSITYTCEKFEFTGIGGNSNNFLTVQHCESYCALRCPRGQPQLDGTQHENDPLASLAVSCADDKGACDTDRFSCSHIHSNAFCCPSPSFICSEFGGLSEEMVDLVSQPQSTPYSAGSNRQGQASVTRWYWNRVERRCRSFRYFGQGGNFNNFLTEAHCAQFCTKSLCPSGTALRDTSGSHIECSSSSQCPRSHTCHSGVCCPSAGTICNQPLSPGSPCSAQTVQRFWFNAATRSCQPFAFTGCDGNSNNFRSLHECNAFCARIEEEPKCPIGEAMKLEDGKFWRCDMGKSKGASTGREEQSCPTNYECLFDGKNYGCCPKKEFTCLLEVEEGRSCNGSPQTRWHFDPSARSCRSFEYKGCDGNSNNFDTQSACVDYCAVSGCPNGGEMHTVDGEAVKCTKDGQCPGGHVCTHLMLFGQSQDDLFCCPSRVSICNQPVDSGFSCAEPARRYHFDPITRVCRPFNFRGCGGNSNNFVTKLACNNMCQAAGCAPSEMAYHPSSSDLPFDCSHKSCPRGYVCATDPFSNERKLCCGAPNMGVCPSNQRPLLDYRNQRPLTCTSLKANDCPARFRCTFNAERSEHFCCGEHHENQLCPSGARLLRLPSTSSSIGCNGDSFCPSGGACHRPHSFQTGVCCSNLDNVCPPMFTLERSLTDEKECSPFVVHSCSDSAKVVCLFSEKLDRFVCCRRDSHKNSEEKGARCPPNTVQDDAHTTCSSSTVCPPPFFCIRQNSERSGVCCKHPRAVIAPSSKEDEEKEIEKIEEKGKEKEKEKENEETKVGKEKKGEDKKEGVKEETIEEESEEKEVKKVKKKSDKTKKKKKKVEKEKEEEEEEEEEEIEENEDSDELKSIHFKIATLVNKATNEKEKEKEKETTIIEYETSTVSIYTSPSTTSPSSPFSTPSPSILLPSPSPTSSPLIFPTTTPTVSTTKVYGIECPLYERPLLDRITGRPTLCADTVPCPTSSMCRTYNIMLSICCIVILPFPQTGYPPPSVVQLPSAPFPTQIPYLPQPTQPPPPSPPTIQGGYSLPSPSHSLPPHPYIPPSVPTSPYIPDRNTVDQVDEDRQCGEGMVPFSTDGQIHSCLNAHCPPKYKCHNEMCCPIKLLACRESLFQGTECRDQRLTSSSTRYYFDPRSNECRAFEYRGCNPGANHFLTLRDCERGCTPDEEGEETEGRRRGGGRGEGDRRGSLCPPPYVNPKDTPTICSPFFDSCPGNHKCLPSRSQHYICCAQPSSTSLRSLIARMCGDGYKPVMSPSGDPRRCDPSRLPCSRRDECRFSTVLMIDICCRTEETTDNFDSNESELSRRGRPMGGVYPRIPRLRSGGTFQIENLQWRDAMDESIRICRLGEEGRECLPRLYPGQSGCLSHSQCLGFSFCVEGRCLCERPYLLFRSLCLITCPPLYQNVRGICLPDIQNYRK